MKSAAYWEERAMSYKMMYEKLKAKCEIATDGETAAESEANSPVVASCEKPTAEEPESAVYIQHSDEPQQPEQYCKRCEGLEAEIEELLYNHPSIYDVGIIGVPDPDWGERIVAYVVTKPGAGISEDDVKNYVGEKLASYKKPKEIYFVDELPYTPSGKLLKRVLREQYKGSA